ncbi:hypothetical protein ABZT47_13040 [Sphaerisporangium sp. NPDC005289]|uniref:hypothetical protein n=1 Tax=Sphaerisporangium sp. NPDC005289 TaxID=3155247 RepID=UPI0033B837A3
MKISARLRAAAVAGSSVLLFGGLTTSTDSTALAQSSSSTASAMQREKLMVFYATKAPCTILTNYGHPAIAWQVPAGAHLVWRYNIDATWAMVSQPAREASAGFPWWGVTQRSCLGNSIQQKEYPAGVPVPSSILTGRSQRESGWRPVRWNVSPSPVARRGVTVTRNATLRDPAHFVLGNIPATWQVDVTATPSSTSWWVKVYVPALARWGYIERNALS